MKTEDYHFEHNYGHGQQQLSAVLASLIILAFLVHTVLEWMDDQYPLLRRKLPSRQRWFGDIRTLTSYLCFESWEALMTFMLQSFEPAPPQPETGSNRQNENCCGSIEVNARMIYILAS